MRKNIPTTYTNASVYTINMQELIGLHIVETQMHAQIHSKAAFQNITCGHTDIFPLCPNKKLDIMLCNPKQQANVSV